MRLTILRCALVLAASVAGVPMHSTHRTIIYLGYASTNYDATVRLGIFRGVAADVEVKGHLLDLSTGVEVQRSGATTTAVVASIVKRAGSGGGTNAVDPSLAVLTVRLTGATSAPLGDYRVLIHYAIETNGPDKFDVALFEHGTVNSVSIATPAQPDGSYLVGQNLTMHVAGTGMLRAALVSNATLHGMKLVQGGPAVANDATFTIRFDSAGRSTFPAGKVVEDGTINDGTLAYGGCPVSCYSGPGSLALILRILPRVTSVSPASGPEGTTVTLTGSRIVPQGYTARVRFLPKYRSGGATILVPATTSGTSLQFVTPAGVRSDSVKLVYTPNTAFFRDSLASLEVDVPPIFVTGGTPALQRLDSIGPAGSRRAMLRLGAQLLHGKNLTTGPTFTTLVTSTRSDPAPALPSLQFGGLALGVQSAGYRSSATNVSGQTGADSVAFTVPTTASFADTMSRSLTITTASGSASVANVLFVPAPLLTDLHTFSSTNNISVNVPLTGSTLVRGKQYRLHGKGLVIRSGAQNLDVVKVRLNGTSTILSVGADGDPVFTVPTTASSGLLSLSAAGGDSQLGPFTVADAPTSVDIVGLNVSPSPLPGGQTVTATVAINGTIPAGGSAGTLAFSLVTPDAAVVLPTNLIPITANPMVVNIPTRAVSANKTVTLRVSNDPNASQLDLMSASLTLTAPAPLDVKLGQAVAFGVMSVRGVVRLNTSAPASAGLSVALSSSDPTTATIPATVVMNGDSAVFTVTTASLPVGVTRTVTVTASIGGQSKSAALIVEAPALMNLPTLAPILPGAAPAIVGVRLNAPLATAATASIACDVVLTCPPTLAFNAGESSAQFAVSARLVPATVTLPISVTLGGVTRNTTLTVFPLAVQTLTISPAVVQAGATSSLTVQLNAPVPTGQSITVSMTSNNAGVRFQPASVTFAAGDVTKLVTILTQAPFAQSAVVTVTTTTSQTTVGGVNSSTKTAPITVNP